LGKRRYTKPKARKQGYREPNGKPSRKIEHVKQREEMTEMEAKSVVIDARRRQGVPEAYLDLSDAGRPNPGTTHGRMHLNGLLTKDQFYAAEWYLGKRTAWLRSIGASDVATPGEGDAGSDAKAYDNWCKAAFDTWTDIRKCLQEVSIAQRSPVIAAFDTILSRHQYLEHMAGDLRLGLNAIHRQFLEGRQRRAA
jgi:hypothetical protein